MEREERWIATVREKLRGADESLPEGGWEALERDLAAAGRRRRAFTPAWKKIAAVAAVVAIAVLIGETVVNQGVVDGDRQTTFFAGELTTADGQLLYDDEPLRNEALTALSEAPAPLVAKVRQALAESRPAAIVAADGSVQTLSGDALAGGGAVVPKRDGSRSTVGCGTLCGRGRSGSRGERGATCRKGRRLAFVGADDRPHASRGSRTAFLRTGAGQRRTSVGLFAAGLPTAQQVSSGRATPLASASPSHVLSSSGIFRMKRGYDDYLYRHKQPLSFGISVRKEFGYGLSLESGLVYSLLRSDVRVSQNDESFSQTLHMLGIPLRVNWDFLSRGDWKLYLGAGGMVEKCLYAKFGSESVAEKELQWSLTANAGVQYDFTRRTALYFEPGVSYYLTETALRTARTVSPVNLSLQLGVRLTY